MKTLNPRGEENAETPGPIADAQPVSEAAT